MHITLTAWRQAGADAPGAFETYDVPGVSPDMSFLEMLDVVNERLMLDGKEPIAFDHDCREGICGSCGMMINGVPHGPERGTATCQLHMRKFQRRRPASRSSRGAPPRSRSSRTSSSTAPRSTGSSSRAATSASAPAARPTATRSRSRSPSPTPRWTRPRASAAARAWPRARTAPRSCSRRRSCSTSTCCRRARPSAGTARSAWSRRWRRTSVRARTTASARPRVPKSISIDFIALMNKDYAKAQLKQRRLVGQSFP